MTGNALIATVRGRDGFALAMAAASDLNGDGFADIIIVITPRIDADDKDHALHVCDAAFASRAAGMQRRRRLPRRAPLEEKC
jgi:hypothetical protein